MKAWKRDFKKPSKSSNEKWYDLYEDWGLIESSIAAQYGIRLRAEPDMTWDEFMTLLTGILPETPLGHMVSIRSENDKEKIKAMSTEQRSIRNAWRNRQAKQLQQTMDAATTIKEVQRMIQSMFGGGGEHR